MASELQDRLDLLRAGARSFRPSQKPPLQAVVNEVVRMEAYRNRRNREEAAEAAATGTALHSPWWRRALGWVVWLIWNVVSLGWSFLLPVIMSFWKELCNATALRDKKEAESKQAEKEKEKEAENADGLAAGEQQNAECMPQDSFPRLSPPPPPHVVEHYHYLRMPSTSHAIQFLLVGVAPRVYQLTQLMAMGPRRLALLGVAG